MRQSSRQKRSVTVISRIFKFCAWMKDYYANRVDNLVSLGRKTVV